MDEARRAEAGPPRGAIDVALLPGPTDDEILQGYLDLVRAWRAPTREPTKAIRFRQVDLAALVGILGTDPQEIERRLVAMTGCTPAAARRFRRLLLIGFAALPLGLPALAFTIPAIAPSTAAAVADAPPDTTVASTIPVGTTAGTTVNGMVEPVAEAMATPASPLPTPVQTPVPAPVETLDPRIEANVSIPSLGINRPVLLGGQSIIDEGVITHFTAPGWREPVAPGAVGTYWLAAHHVTHGGPFLALPDITIGSPVEVRTSAGTFTYEVTSLEVVLADAGYGPVYGADPDARLLLLQTCLDSVRRLLVHGVLLATS